MISKVTRRNFLKLSAIAAGFSAFGGERASAAVPEPTAARLPAWRGVNLLEKFMMPTNEPFRESDFAMLAELGFNFARLPMDYRCWVDSNDWTEFREEVLKQIDDVVALGEKHGVHIQINFHRAPGYTVAEPRESLSIWKDEEVRRVCALHWAKFAERYTGIPNARLSFNLFNEPAIVKPDVHRTVVSRMLDAIRKHDPDRLVICDGRNYARTPPEELLGLGVAASLHCYDPFRLTHYKAGWVKGADKFDEPTYPMKEGNILWNKDTLYQKTITPWKELEAKGMGVFTGEFGAFSHTPHPVVLSWLRDCISLWKQAGWGWAMWNFRGPFGFIDSGRTDVDYEDYHGHKLDRALLDIVR